MLSGTTHKSGIGATFCVKWLVVASSSVEAQAASATQKILVPTPGGGASSSASVGTGISALLLIHPAAAHASAKTAYAEDQMMAWRLRVSRGSMTKG